MDKPTEKKEKVIITPRPPRAINDQWIPIEPVGPKAPAGEVEPVAPVDPGCGPMNNVVEGPAQGLAGVPAEEEPAEEE